VLSLGPALLKGSPECLSGGPNEIAAARLRQHHCDRVHDIGRADFIIRCADVSRCQSVIVAGRRPDKGRFVGCTPVAGGALVGERGGQTRSGPAASERASDREPPELRVAAPSSQIDPVRAGGRFVAGQTAAALCAVRDGRASRVAVARAASSTPTSGARQRLGEANPGDSGGGAEFAKR
jgi:hypothetical protein